MVLVDALIRQLPGASGASVILLIRTHLPNGLLDCPHYTRPEEQLSGPRSASEYCSLATMKKSRRWRLQQSLMRTQQRRPDLLDRLALNKEQQALLKEASTALADDTERITSSSLYRALNQVALPPTNEN